MRTTYCPKCDDKVRYYTDFGAQNSWLRICTDCETDLNYNFKLSHWKKSLERDDLTTIFLQKNLFTNWLCENSLNSCAADSFAQLCEILGVI